MRGFPRYTAVVLAAVEDIPEQTGVVVGPLVNETQAVQLDPGQYDPAEDDGLREVPLEQLRAK